MSCPQLQGARQKASAKQRQGFDVGGGVLLEKWREEVGKDGESGEKELQDSGDYALCQVTPPCSPETLTEGS